MALVGPELKVGDKAPDFEATASDLAPARLSALLQSAPLASASVKIISSVASLDTGVCSDETHRFEDEISKLGGKAALITVSMDLPFAQGRFCGPRGAEAPRGTAAQEGGDCGAPKPGNVFLSDHRLADFGQKYGVLIKEMRLLCRAVFVVDLQNKIVHVQYVKETGTHPDYDAVLEAVKKEI